MNLNDFVVLPNNKAKSVKLNARNLQELHMETVTLAQDSKEMEEKLQQLKERMSKEKEERRHSGWFRWKSGQCGSLTSTGPTSSAEKNKNRLERLSAGKVKIRVLKDEPLTAPPQPPPPPPPPTIGIRTTRKNRLRGRYCGQCEVRSAGLMCAECTEDYCIGCFARFHQKGALKLHRMIPIQADLQTHVSTQDVVSCFQEQNNPCSNPSTFTSLDPGLGSKPSPDHTIKSKALAVNHGEEKMPEIIEEEPKKEVEWGFPTTLLRGDYNEEESARSFQEALRQWRGERSDGAEEPVTEDTNRRVPVRVEFTESSLTNMDRLLLKRHRRTPIETYPLLAFGTDLNPLSNTSTEEETTSSLTAEEEDFRHYFASLFAVPVSRGMTEPQITPESCLIIEVLDERERDTDGDVAEQRTGNRK
ncbi:zinc finger B-box domain-containing protein 1-like [Chaetodon trifascialis]|uniref:zinc finger B-box domain-containing protein 1-like n=1 Tax=Chaetodon trifascialis TaxID=109706 RepID=UPI003996C753